MNNEPVAYAMFKDDEFYDAIHPKQYTEHIGSYTIPLYTHPHHDNLGLALSIIDQQKLEIEALKKNLDVALMIVNEPTKTLTDYEINSVWATQDFTRYMGFQDFARAILRKTQEK